jgi:hypothetical protein
VKRLLSLLVLALFVVQLLVLPVMVNAAGPQITPSVTNITSNGATLNAQIKLQPAGTSGPGPLDTMNFCTIYVQYGTSPDFLGMSTTPIPFTPDDVTVTVILTGLQPCMTYYARFVENCRLSATTLLPAQTDTHGVGIGIDPANVGSQLNGLIQTVNGTIFSFRTLCPPPTSHGAGFVGPSIRPYLPSNITVQSASLSAPKVGPGENVQVTANMINKGGSNGDAKVTLYVNGQEVESKGVALASGASAPVQFNVSQNEPGTYTVYVGGTSAGSFVVDPFTNNEILIYGLIALFTIGIAGTLYLVTRKRAV